MRSDIWRMGKYPWKYNPDELPKAKAALEITVSKRDAARPTGSKLHIAKKKQTALEKQVQGLQDKHKQQQEDLAKLKKATEETENELLDKQQEHAATKTEVIMLEAANAAEEEKEEAEAAQHALVETATGNGMEEIDGINAAFDKLESAGVDITDKRNDWRQNGGTAKTEGKGKTGSTPGTPEEQRDNETPDDAMGGSDDGTDTDPEMRTARATAMRDYCNKFLESGGTEVKGTEEQQKYDQLCKEMDTTISYGKGRGKGKGKRDDALPYHRPGPERRAPPPPNPAEDASDPDAKKPKLENTAPAV